MSKTSPVFAPSLGWKTIEVFGIYRFCRPSWHVIFVVRFVHDFVCYSITKSRNVETKKNEKNNTIVEKRRGKISPVFNDYVPDCTDRCVCESPHFS